MEPVGRIVVEWGIALPEQFGQVGHVPLLHEAVLLGNGLAGLGDAACYEAAGGIDVGVGKVRVLALKAKLPILLYAIDYPTKTIHCKRTLVPSGDVEKDMRIIMQYYKNYQGKHPEKFAVEQI